MKNHTHNKKIEYIIEYAGLNAGEHLFEFKITDDFIQQYFNELLNNHFNIHVSITLIKYNHSIQAKIQFTGTISVTCDKCLIPYQYPVHSESLVHITYGNPENSTDEILFVEENNNKINFSQHLYESIMLALPNKIVPCEAYTDALCDTDVLEKIHQDLSEQNKSLTFAELLKNKFNNH